MVGPICLLYGGVRQKLQARLSADPAILYRPARRVCVRPENDGCDAYDRDRVPRQLPGRFGRVDTLRGLPRSATLTSKSLSWPR
jgi:hypothetical protein